MGQSMIDEAREKGLYEGLEKRMLNLKKAVMMVEEKNKNPIRDKSLSDITESVEKE